MRRLAAAALALAGLVGIASRASAQPGTATQNPLSVHVNSDLQRLNVVPTTIDAMQADITVPVTTPGATSVWGGPIVEGNTTKVQYAPGFTSMGVTWNNVSTSTK